MALADICMLFVIVFAIGFDVKSRRIPNLLIALGLLLAFACHISTGEIQGILFALKGFGTGILLLLLPFFMGGIGAGDVKLLGVVGAFQGSVFVFYTFIAMALWGGFIVLIYLIHSGRLKQTLVKICNSMLLLNSGMLNAADYDKREFDGSIPYGVAIGLGAVSTYLQGWWL